MELQDVQELTNFFERRVSAYQVAVAGEVGFHEDFSSVGQHSPDMQAARTLEDSLPA